MGACSENPKPVNTTRLLEKISDASFDCAAMKWGRDHEKEALDAFHALESDIHEAMSLRLGSIQKLLCYCQSRCCNDVCLPWKI